MASPTLDDIAARGNRGIKPSQNRDNNKIICADGFTLSVIAGAGSYCKPRPDMFSDWDGPMADPIGMYDVGGGYPGPYTHVEVGMPSARPEPWHCSEWHDGFDNHEQHAKCDGWQIYGDDDEVPTIYGYVPVEMVRALIQAHGGER